MPNARRDLRDSVNFWLAMGGGIALIGGILVAVGVAQVAKLPDGNLWLNAWFDGGITAVIFGAMAMLWSLVLFLAHGHAIGHAQPTRAPQPFAPSRPSRPAAATRVPAPPPTALDPARPMVPDDVTPEQLKAMCAALTGVQAKRMMEPYLGRWMTVVGVVRDVDEVVGVVGQLRITFQDRPVYAYFDGDQSGDASLRVRGDQITVHGQIARAGSIGAALEHCEIWSG